ncbi:AcrR family transcriptional regulator [Nocardioides zeae]|uniref:AcrR family transcriptional regulator n=1 Tax=Nocardioides zeae TaxID=1457234 RepID=A0ACC6IDV9_9ACTN|nr:AcrR family transcriptional regulator [Nocardioides zeae]MDR6208916.1 AcrR family transcriptional regulator [Nocardioides zeae]
MNVLHFGIRSANLHFVSTSAESGAADHRASKREETARRIMVSAQRLATEHGLDGFTMDELAAASGVSRRTLFNYYPSKVDACLGPPIEVPASAMEAFASGGPTGDLGADLEHLAREVLGIEEPTREEMVLHRQLFQNPRLVEALHDRFAELAVDLEGAVRARGGEQIDQEGALLLIRVLLVVFDTAIDASIAGDDTPLSDLFSRHFGTLRRLLA